MKFKYTKKEIKEFILGILGILLYITILCGATIGVCILFKTEIEGFIISTLEKIPPQFLPEIATQPQPFYERFLCYFLEYMGIPILLTLLGSFFCFLQKGLKNKVKKINIKK